MIKFINISEEAPYRVFDELYSESADVNQKNIEAVCIASSSAFNQEVNARFVNLKFVNEKEFIFFSNYNSPKAKDFISNNHITAVIYWNSINVQIRMKALINKASEDFNKNYFAKRDIKKNALAISSDQSKFINSYEQVEENFKQTMENSNLSECPEYWGGYSFIPYSFEFWRGHESRLNKRELYVLENNSWSHSFLQP